MQLLTILVNKQKLVRLGGSRVPPSGLGSTKRLRKSWHPSRRPALLLHRPNLFATKSLRESKTGGQASTSTPQKAFTGPQLPSEQLPARHSRQSRTSAPSHCSAHVARRQTMHRARPPPKQTCRHLPSSPATAGQERAGATRNPRFSSLAPPPRRELVPLHHRAKFG